MKLKSSLLAATLFAIAQGASAQLTLTGSSYSENFDGLASGLPAGWSVRLAATMDSPGTNAPFTTNTTSWGSTSGQFANYAGTINDGTNCLGTESAATQAAFPNRCLGMRQTTSFGDPGAAFVLQIDNTLGFGDFELSVDCGILSSQARSTTWTIDYGIGSQPAQFVSVDAYADPGAFGCARRTIPFGTALDNQSQSVCIRIVALENAIGSGSRDTFAIDNVTLTYAPASGGISPVPLTWEKQGETLMLTWTNAAFSLQSASSPAAAFTNVPGASSPHPVPTVEGQQYFRLVTEQ
jgi:hypothetical protein